MVLELKEAPEDKIDSLWTANFVGTSFILNNANGIHSIQTILRPSKLPRKSIARFHLLDRPANVITVKALFSEMEG